MMDQSTFKSKAARLNDYLIRIGDLVNFEGPLLSLFEDVKNGHLYIFDWVDRFDKTNRWLIYQVYPKKLLDFIQKKISYLDLFKSPVNNVYYFTDIGSSISSGNYNINLLDGIPEKYIPNENDFFDKSGSPNYDKIILFLINKKHENLYSTGLVVTSINNHLKSAHNLYLKNGENIPNQTHLLSGPNKYNLTIHSKQLIGTNRSRYKSKRYA